MKSQICSLLMETLFPTSLEAYCEYFNISFFKLNLKCIFCKNYLSPVDLALFHVKQLSLVWKQHVSYACCNRCLLLSAKFESEKYFQCACPVENLHALLEKPLQEIILRCYYCYSLLDLAEKFDLISRSKQACLVRGHWRAPCRNCIKQEFWV